MKKPKKKVPSRMMKTKLSGLLIVAALMFDCARPQDEEALAIINRSAAQIDSALVKFEQAERLPEALAAYRAVDRVLTQLELETVHPHYRKQQSVHAQCLLRLGNMLRQLDQKDEARTVGQRELLAARAAGDTITLARTLISNGVTLIATGETASGLAMMEEARRLFAQDTSADSKQGLGWYWILQADLAEAGYTSASFGERSAFADSALHLLLPLKNWPGVARAYAARAQANKARGNFAAARVDSIEQARYQTLIGER
ncbi:MAG: hypothetical protein AAB354_05450 [candidate division KSB1 bacterium]|mgnify:CR=1 FL=1